MHLSLPSMSHDLHVFLKNPSTHPLHRTFTIVLGDLDIPMYLDLPLEDLFLFISWERPLSNKAYVL
jgi:hypothetical protein